LSTNAKDIGTLYLIFAIFSGLLGGLIAIYLLMFYIALINIINLSLLFPSLLLFNGDSESSKSSNKAESEGSSGNGSDGDPEDKKTVNHDPENRKTIIRDNPHGAENIMDDLDDISAAKKGDQGALDRVKEQYPAFFDTTDSDKEVLDQIEKYLEDDFENAKEDEEAEAAKLDQVAEEFHQSTQKRKFDEEDDNSNSKRQRKSDSDDDNNGKGGPGGFSSGPSGPSSSGFDGNGPDSSSRSSKIMEISLSFFVLCGGILDNIAEVVSNLFS
jgi:hypothetical protein